MAGTRYLGRLGNGVGVGDGALRIACGDDAVDGSDFPRSAAGGRPATAAAAVSSGARISTCSVNVRASPG